MNYLLDANVFIEAKNRYYGMDICPGFWEWLDYANSHHSVGSIIAVRDELMDGKDDLASWAKEREFGEFFVQNDDKKTQKLYREVVNHVMDGDYKQQGKDEFLEKADPFLIAKAISLEAYIVTHEKYSKDAKKRVLIPNVCKDFDVECIDTFALLRKFGASFVTKS